MFEDLEKLQTPAMIHTIREMRIARYKELQNLPRWTDEEAAINEGDLEEHNGYSCG